MNHAREGREMRVLKEREEEEIEKEEKGGKEEEEVNVNDVVNVAEMGGRRVKEVVSE